MGTTIDRPTANDLEMVKLREDLLAVRPDLAVRLDAILDARSSADADQNMRTGEASKALGVSRNTLKKWVKVGLIAAVSLPGGTEMRIPRKEIDRVRDYAIARVAMAALGDDAEAEGDQEATSDTLPWQR
jgi:excisionase family DNA binding protein